MEQNKDAWTTLLCRKGDIFHRFQISVWTIVLKKYGNIYRR
jgi:hypothetical protein